MPQYAPYGNAIYGLTAYGSPPAVYVQTTMTVSPIPTSGTPSASLYNSLYLNWILPGGNWNQMVLVRSSFAVPASPFSSDGVQLLSQGQMATPQTNPSTSFVDTGLVSGRFYYYALFVYDTDVNEWLMAASVQGLCLTDYGFENLFIAWTPDWFMEQDQMLVPAAPLARFFGLIGFEMNWVRSEIETLFTLNSPEYISGAMLPYLGGNVGVGYEPALGMGLSRNLVSQAVELYKIKGTFLGVQGAASAYSGYGCILTLGPNEEIQLDDATFDRSGGHWAATNAGTSFSTVSTTLKSSPAFQVVPAHAGYLPVQGNTGLSTALIAQSNAFGYLPSNNENIALLSAQSAFMWTQGIQNSSIPPALLAAGAAYYPITGNTVMFGGYTSYAFASPPGTPINQTWVFNGKYWTQKFPANSPPARGEHGMGYDPVSGKIIIFGGYDVNGNLLGDTWSWDGTNWTHLTPGTSPSARAGHMMCQWSSSGVVLFGGLDNSGARNDTWLWNGTNWVLQSPVHSPAVRYSGGMVYNSFEQATPNLTTGVVVLFGGQNNSGPFSDTWIWNGVDWASPSTVHTPAARANLSMAYNVALDSVILFGGYDPSSTNAFNDTWLWSPSTGGGGDWRLINNSFQNPTARLGSIMAYDALGTVVMNGGQGPALFGTVYNDSWLYNGTSSQWNQIDGTQTPLPRKGAAQCYDSTNARILLWGGINTSVSFGTSNGFLNSMWSWTSAAGWTQLAPNTLPPGAYGARMVFTTGSNVILFGGEANGTPVSTTWSWNGTTWSQVSPSGGPPAARYNHQMVYDSNASKVILFGGNTGSGFLNDTWTYTVGGSTWASLSPTLPPSARTQAGMVYTTTGVSVLFGGLLTGNTTSSDTWQFSSVANQWSKLSPVGIPKPRYDQLMVYNSTVGAVFMFGGASAFSSPTYYTDSWEFQAGNWSTVNFGTPTPLPRVDGMMTYSVAGTQMVLFGGTSVEGGTVQGDTWSGAVAGYGIAISECNTSNATTLGIPVVQLATPQTLVLSGYFQPVPAATPIVESFVAQLDWYSSNGAPILPSSVGAPVQEIAGQWVRASVAATPPAGAAYVGRTFKSVNVAMTGDRHLFDAAQLEVNTLATPGPTAWSPPRDLWLNLFPAARNLIVNGQGLAGSFGWTTPLGGVLTEVSTGPTSNPRWPAGVNAGFKITGHGSWQFYTQTAPMPINASDAYSGSFWVQPSGSGIVDQWVVNIAWYATSNPFSSPLSTTHGTQTVNTTTGTWSQVGLLNVTAPVGANYARMQIVAAGTGSIPSPYYLAAPLFNQGVNVAYFDGTFSPSPDYAFEGTPNKSPTAWYPNVLTRLDRLIEVMPDYTPIGSTFSIYTHALAWTNAGLH